MRRLNLVPEEVLARRRARALLGRSTAQLLGLALVLGVLLGIVHRWREDERAALAEFERRALRVAEIAAALDSLGAAVEARASRLRALEALAGQRPVTGLVTLLATWLPAGVRLDNLAIESATSLRAAVAPGGSGYFEDGGGGGTELVLRGVARTSDDVAAMLRGLESTARFRRVQLARLDRPATGESALLGFEVRCRL